LASWCFASRQGRRLIGCQILASRLRIPALIVTRVWAHRIEAGRAIFRPKTTPRP
jgi:hypothetical protein